MDKGIRFRESMPRPLLIAFVVAAAIGIGFIVVLMVRPPTPNQLAAELRRSPPRDPFTHDVVDLNPVDIPTPLPSFAPPCPQVAGLVVEGGPPAVDRLGRALRPLCAAFTGLPPEAQQGLRGLAGARIRFALFTRTGEQSTSDVAAKRIYLSVVLSRRDVAAGELAPLLVHEGWHLADGPPVTAADEYGARLAELQICRRFFEPAVFTRGCLDAQAIVQLGEERAVELLARAGFPR